MTETLNFFKNFADWFKLKPQLDEKSYNPPKFSSGQVWYCFAGENIGVEISGKGSDYLRPYLILQKLDRYSFIDLPLSTRSKSGNRYFQINFRSKNQIVYLHQPRHFDYRRLKYKLGEVTTNEFSQINKEFVEQIKPKNNLLN